MKDGEFWEKEKYEKKKQRWLPLKQGGTSPCEGDNSHNNSHKGLEGISQVDSRGRPFQKGETAVLRLVCWRNNSKKTSVIGAE